MKQADAAESNEEANHLNDRAVALKVSNSKLDLRIVQLDRTTKSFLQDMKKVGPNLKDIRLKLNKNWIPVWLKKPSDFRATTKMPNFRLNDEQVKAISAYIWQSALTDPLPKHQPGNAAHGKELFETRGCLACHSIGEGDQMQGGTFAANLTRVGEKDNYDYFVRWVHNARERTRPYCPYEKKDIGPEDYAKKGLPYVFDLEHTRVPERWSRTASAEYDRDAQPAALSAGCPGRRQLSDHTEEAGAVCLTPMRRSWTIPNLKEEGKKWVRHFGCAGCHEISGLEDEGRIGTELTFEGSKPIERLDFALLTEVAQRGGNEPIADPDDLARLPEGPAKSPWYDQKGFFEHKLAEPNIWDKGKIKPETEKLRMPNLHLTKEQVASTHDLPDGWPGKPSARQLSIPPTGLPPGYSRRLVGRSQVQLHGLPSAHSRPEDFANDHGALPRSRRARATSSQTPDGRRASRAAMAAAFPYESGIERLGHQSQRRTSLLASAHADVLFFGK